MSAQMWRIRSHFPGHKGMILPTSVAGGHRAHEGVDATTSSCQWRPSAAPEQMEAEAAEDTLLLPHRREVLEVGELVPTRSKGQECLCWGGSTRRTESAEGAAVQDYKRRLRGHVPPRPFQTQQQQKKKNCSPSSSRASSRQSLFLVAMWSVRTGDECEEVETLLPWRLNSWPEALRNKKIPINTSCKTYEDTLIGNDSGSPWLRTEEKTARCRKRSRVVCTWVSCEVWNVLDRRNFDCFLAALRKTKSSTLAAFEGRISPESAD